LKFLKKVKNQEEEDKMKTKNKNTKSTVMVCLIGVVVLMSILTGLMIERLI